LNAALYLVGSLVLALLAFAVVLPLAMPREPEVPETYPVEVEAVQTLLCTGYRDVKIGDYQYRIPSSYAVDFTIYAKSHTRKTVTIVKFVPDTMPDASLLMLFTLSPYEHAVRTFRAPWGSAGSYTAMVFPGDTVRVTQTRLEIERGTIYSSRAPISYESQLPIAFNCPFTGVAESRLNVAGEEVWALIRNPGCAGVILRELSQPKFLILADYMVKDYYDASIDVPFFLLVREGANAQVGFFRKPAEVGVIYGTHKSKTGTGNSGYQAAAFWYDGSRGELYLDNSGSLVLRTGAVSIRGGDVILGVAREGSARGEVQILSSYVRYVGVFKDKDLKITGLVPGDKVVLQAGGTTRMYTAVGDTLVVDLLYAFTPRELVDAARSGGIRLTINPSEGRPLLMMPASGKVLVRSDVHEMWIAVDVPVRVECAPSLTVHSKSGRVYAAVITTSDYRSWRVEFNGENLGTYQKAVVTVVNGTVKIYTSYYRDPYVYTAPQDGYTIKINTAPPDYVGVMVGAMMLAIPHVQKIEVEGALYHLELSHGK